jgi:hypothetical protein
VTIWCIVGRGAGSRTRFRMTSFSRALNQQ